MNRFIEHRSDPRLTIVGVCNRGLWTLDSSHHRRPTATAAKRFNNREIRGLKQIWRLHIQITTPFLVSFCSSLSGYVAMSSSDFSCRNYSISYHFLALSTYLWHTPSRSLNSGGLRRSVSDSGPYAILCANQPRNVDQEDQSSL